jgi:DNA-binding MarR family transcriptional regulator
MGQGNKRALTGEILTLMGEVSERFEPDNQEMKQWMMEHFHNPIIVDLLRETTFTMLRVLDAVGQLEPVNGITIAKQYRIPKGSVSKSTRRLLAQDLISKEPLPNNKKEFLFRLTPLGRELFEAHRAFDQQMERGFVQFLSRYSADDLRFIARLLSDIRETSFLKLGDEPADR